MTCAFARTVESRYAELTPTAKRIASYMLANLDRLGRDGRPDRAAGRHQRHLGRAVPAQRRLPQPRRPEARTARRRRPPVDDHRPARRIPPRRRHASGRTRRQRPRGRSRRRSSASSMRSATYRLAEGRCSRRWPTGSRRRTPCSSSASSRRAGSATRSAATSNTCARACSIRTASQPYVDSLNSEFERPYCIVTDTRAYSRSARYCQAAAERGQPFALVTDLSCPWARLAGRPAAGEDRRWPVLGFARAAHLPVQPADHGRGRPPRPGNRPARRAQPRTAAHVRSIRILNASAFRTADERSPPR